jgi:hypothetical protein
MRLRKDEVFARALRAAAATTALVLAGCGGSKGAQPQPPGNASAGGDEGSAAGSATDMPDAAVAVERDCEDDPGYSSKCCTAEREAGRSPIACTPWGPPAPPAYHGETIA